MPRRIRLGLFITELGLGGAEKSLSLLARGLPREEFEVHVACLFGPEPIGTLLREEGIPVEDFRTAGRLDFRAIWRCRSWCREHRLDILHSFLFHANLVSRLARRRGEGPILFNSQRSCGLETPLQRLLYRATERSVQRFTAVSMAAKDHLVRELGVSSEKVVVVPNGVDLAEFDREAGARFPVEDGAPLVGTIGHMRRDDSKGYLTLGTAARLVGKRSAARFLACGEVDEKVRGQVEADGIRLLGVRQDIPAFLRALDIYLQPSRSEGMPNAILEAMAARRPVVATAVGGVPEVVEDGETGILVPPDRPEEMAEAILTLLGSPDRAAAMGEAGRNRIERHFTSARMIQSHRNLYKEGTGTNL